MSNFFEWTKPNEVPGDPGGKDIDLNYGLDTDNAQYDEDYNFLGNEETPMVGVRYGDYDVRRAGVGSAGSGLIVPPEPDSGVPNMDDYITVTAPKTGRGGIYMKDFLSGNQSDSLDIMTEGVNNGRVHDMKIIKDTVLPEESEIVIKKDNQQTAIKGLLEKNSINDIFFSDMNIKGLQDTIRYGVHQETGQVISGQSDNELYVVMRSVMLQYANFRADVNDIVNEIKRLNQKVLIYCIQNISSNVQQHMGYVEDLSKLPTPMDMPVYHNKKNFTYDISNLL